MRRVFRVANPALLITACLLVCIPVALGQRGGGGHAGGFSGGHAGGFSGGFSGHSFGGFSGSVGRSFGNSSFGSRGYSYAPRVGSGYSVLRAPNYASSWGVARSGDRGRGGYRYRSPYRGYGYGYPYGVGGWGVLPWELGYPDFYGYDNSAYDNSAYDNGSGVSEPGADPAPQGYYPAPPPDDDARPAYGDGPYRQAAVASAPVPDEPALTLIFNDGHQQSIRNYALTSNYILVLDNAASGHQQRIPLADLNLPATEKAAENAGLEFSPPA